MIEVSLAPGGEIGGLALQQGLHPADDLAGLAQPISPEAGSPAVEKSARSVLGLAATPAGYAELRRQFPRCRDRTEAERGPMRLTCITVPGYIQKECGQEILGEL